MSACDARRKCRRLRPMLTRRAWAASGGRQAPAASCRDCSAAWLPQEQIPVSWCRDCSAVAAPPLSLSNLAKAQTRMLTGMDPGSYGPHSRARDGGYLPALLVGMNGASLHNRVNCTRFNLKRRQAVTAQVRYWPVATYCAAARTWPP
jgi:hypothetical protein